MTIAGDGPERHRLEQEAARLGIRTRLVLRGVCSRDEIRTLLASASMLAHPGHRNSGYSTDVKRPMESRPCRATGGTTFTATNTA
jgi:hypothetical protein